MVQNINLWAEWAHIDMSENCHEDHFKDHKTVNSAVAISVNQILINTIIMRYFK